MTVRVVAVVLVIALAYAVAILLASRIHDPPGLHKIP